MGDKLHINSMKYNQVYLKKSTMIKFIVAVCCGSCDRYLANLFGRQAFV